MPLPQIIDICEIITQNDRSLRQATLDKTAAAMKQFLHVLLSPRVAFSIVAVLLLLLIGVHFGRRLRAMAIIEQSTGFVSFRNASGGVPETRDVQARLRDNVERISLAGARLTPQSLSALRSLPEVEFISFNSSTFSDDYVGYLDELSNLKELQLNGTRITHAGLSHLSQWHRLTHLTLNDTSITDDCFDALASIKSLKHLHLHGTKLSDDTLSELKVALPGCRIHFWRKDQPIGEHDN